MPEKLLYDVGEACALVGFSRATLYRLIDAGRITPVRVGRSVYITPDELRAFVERLKAEAGLT